MSVSLAPERSNTTAAAKVCTPPDAAAAPAKTAAKTAVKTGAPIDQVTLSSGASDTKSNPFPSVSEESATVTVDKWKSGKNDSVEGILRNQGYSLKEIYTKDENGKTLIDHVASVNNLKNPNVIQPGQSLTVPTREGSESLSSMDLEAGETQSSKVRNEQAGIQTDSTMSKDESGTSKLDIKVNNDNNRNTELSSQTTSEGRIDTTTRTTDGGTESNTVSMNQNGTAVSQERITAEKDGTEVHVKDIDGNVNMSVSADANTVRIKNPGSGAGDIDMELDISEESSDGRLENLGRKINDFLFGPGEQPEGGSVEGASDVRVTKDAQGRTVVTATVNGEEKVIVSTPGDTDDSFLERVGATLDDGASRVKKGAKGLINRVRNLF